MNRFCPHCKEFDNTKAKIVKLAKPIEERKEMAGGIYDVIITHRCENCGAGTGNGTPVKVKGDM